MNLAIPYRDRDPKVRLHDPGPGTVTTADKKKASESRKIVGELSESRKIVGELSESRRIVGESENCRRTRRTRRIVETVRELGDSN